MSDETFEMQDGPPEGEESEKTSDITEELEEAKHKARRYQNDRQLKNRKSPLNRGRENTRPEKKKSELRAENSGYFDKQKIEEVPGFKLCSGDVPLSGKNNQWIIFCRDRPAGYTSGYGPGQGENQAGAIDMVVGRMSPHPRSKRPDNTPMKVGPIFNSEMYRGDEVVDAARIYISQRTDMDHNFKLSPGRIGRPKDRSGICMKADGVRIIARDAGIKLVTQHNQLINSRGNRSTKINGIDIIAGNNAEDLQPMVLGNNLVECLTSHGVLLDRIVGTIASLIENISALDLALATHIHPQAFPAGIPNIIDPRICSSAVLSISKLVSLDAFSAFAEKYSIEKIDKQYLQPGGEQSILSSHNNVN
tara:strand:+ start:51210 stop:52298 length:1089 start_codon:yes stop_codon:yes gene_type:complete